MYQAGCEKGYPIRRRLTCRTWFGDIIRPPNLELKIAVPGREREQGRFRGSIEGIGGSTKGAGGHGGSRGEH